MRVESFSSPRVYDRSKGAAWWGLNRGVTPVVPGDKGDRGGHASRGFPKAFFDSTKAG